MPVNDSLGLLAALSAREVDFVVVGGTAAVLHGCAAATFDLDVLMVFTPENCERLLQAVQGLHPRFAHTPDKRPMQLTALELVNFKNLYLLTDLGRLDVLGSLPPIEHVEDVFRDSEVMAIAGLGVRVVSLEQLLRVKSAMERPKDKMVAAELRAIRDIRDTPKG